MPAAAPIAHNKRNFLLCLLGTFILFSVGSATVLSFLPNTIQEPPRGPLILVLGATLTLVISPLAILLAFVYMHLSGGFLPTKAIKVYLFVTRGKHIVASKSRNSRQSGPHEACA